MGVIAPDSLSVRVYVTEAATDDAAVDTPFASIIRSVTLLPCSFAAQPA